MVYRNTNTGAVQTFNSVIRSPEWEPVTKVVAPKEAPKQEPPKQELPKQEPVTR